jgi:uncharacterized membrane protein
MNFGADIVVQMRVSVVLVLVIILAVAVVVGVVVVAIYMATCCCRSDWNSCNLVATKLGVSIGWRCPYISGSCVSGIREGGEG